MKWTSDRKWLRAALPILTAGALALACGDDNKGAGTTGPTISDLAGTWNATTVLLTWNANPSVSVDLVQTLGLTVELVVNTNGTYSFTASLAGTPALPPVTGDFDITGSGTFTLTNDADPTDVLSGTFTLSTNGNQLTINMQDVELFDFDQDGTDDPAEMDASFNRVT